VSSDMVRGDLRSPRMCMCMRINQNVGTKDATMRMNVGRDTMYWKIFKVKFVSENKVIKIEQSKSVI
jgi:hypothetical protein